MADPAPVSKSAVCKAGIVLRRIARGTGPSRRRRWPGGRDRRDGAQEQRSHGPRGTRGSGRAGAVVGVFAVVAVRPVGAGLLWDDDARRSARLERDVERAVRRIERRLA